jgi:hypothetical protein
MSSLRRPLRSDVDFLRHRPRTLAEPRPKCIELVRAVEHGEAWRARYDSLESTYIAHEAATGAFAAGWCVVK